MARILSDEPCKVTFDDNIGGGNLTVFFRPPTPQERMEYSNSQVSRHGRKVDSILGNTRMKFGLKIITGIADGDFVKGDKKPLSSDPTSPNYDENWKDIIKRLASDVISMLAIHAFENALNVVDGVEEKDGEDPT
jgi:hypothetical protein